MRTHGETVRGNEMVIPHVDLESVKDWAKATFTKQRVQEAALCVATVSVIGTVLFSLHKAMDSYLIMGF